MAVLDFYIESPEESARKKEVAVNSGASLFVTFRDVGKYGYIIPIDYYTRAIKTAEEFQAAVRQVTDCNSFSRTDVVSVEVLGDEFAPEMVDYLRKVGSNLDLECEV